MGIEKDVRKLKAEELEKRLAPLAIYVEPEPSDPTSPTGPTGGGGLPEPPVPEPPRMNPAGNEMGDSYDHRQDVVNEP